MPANDKEKAKQLHALGYECQLAGEWEEAKQYYNQALAIDSDYALSKLALAQLRMLQTGFREGRELYEARFATREEEGGFDWRHLPMPRWRGEALAGKHLHLWVEQGFGDVIMYAGFLPWLLMQKPARITLSMFPKMMTLFARSFPQVAVESLQDIGGYAVSPTILDSFPQLLAMTQHAGLQIDLEPMRRDYEHAQTRGKPDFTAPMGDLMVYGLPGFVPARQNAAYMLPQPQRVAEMKKYLHTLGAGRTVGISWHTPNAQSGAARNIPLGYWLPILRVPGCRFVSLQHGVSALEIERFCVEHNCRMADPGFDVIQDTEALAALTACVDEVITIDNSTVHLAGALGMPTTLLLPKGCDFRWPVLEGDKDTLWYGSVKLERQNEAMQWQPVIQRVAAELLQRA